MFAPENKVCLAKMRYVDGTRRSYLVILHSELSLKNIELRGERYKKNTLENLKNRKNLEDVSCRFRIKLKDIPLYDLFSIAC